MDPTHVELLILDVDGVLTDGTVAATSHGEPVQRFCVLDGCAIKLWRQCGHRVAILSGRGGEALTRRAAELGIDWVHTNVETKLPVYEAIRSRAGCDHRAVGYVGDDLPDLPPMSRAGFPVAVANAHPAVKRASMYVTRRRGGLGAVAEVVELLLRKQKRWSCELFEG